MIKVGGKGILKRDREGMCGREEWGIYIDQGNDPEGGQEYGYREEEE